MAELTITILVENTVGAPLGLVGEWGSAMLVETGGQRILLDTGEKGGIMPNAEALGVDLRAVDALVLSHGHYDHSGGMRAFLKLRGSLPVYIHPDFFSSHYYVSSIRRYIGVPHHREELIGLGAELITVREPLRLNPQLWVSSEVPRRTSFEVGDTRLVRKGEGGIEEDPLLDDMSLYALTSQGLVIILGCAHAGLVNIIEHAREVTGERRIYGIIGGTHLGPVAEPQLQATIEYLQGLDLKFLAVNHCTGLPVIARLAGIFGEIYHFAPAGAKFRLPLET